VRVALFWHIPWPNFEAFGICPWQREILEGMLGADLIGFHTQYHCNNFLETVERAIECRVDWEHFAVVRGPRTTYVQAVPDQRRARVRGGPAHDHAPGASRQPRHFDRVFGVGVERIDYTKGLPERFLALQRFFERYPAYASASSSSSSRLRAAAGSSATGAAARDRGHARPGEPGRRDAELAADRSTGKATTIASRSGPSTVTPTSAW